MLTPMTAEDVAAQVLPRAPEDWLQCTATALREIAERFSASESGQPTIGSAMVSEQLLTVPGREAIVEVLLQQMFFCRWVHPTFEKDARGFTLRQIGTFRVAPAT